MYKTLSAGKRRKAVRKGEKYIHVAFTGSPRILLTFGELSNETDVEKLPNNYKINVRK